ncbi:MULTISPECIES: DUF4311 domain-containing protein [Brevibacillus]|jgi:uncharacterized protein (TIGR03580 family)|uniref:DUF4311 domain-containing protein n=1 Tax=Brevibacillus aydinogluensis TaxID=927786 RepID=A0AA48MBM4_9BACL|nr:MULTISPECIES: DUF4311 domain-containing protein [Bacillales]MBR8660862.1 DUF4311 domain-containing protein [Brevibacillus sp. NL20B1]MDT3414274.1 uncharacterized protein (TIGR03580 family) [Brevibacillus aydinogluensis]UFJ59875.1 DUF4311 domain-containing protein [Anoxybacillus sediminis]CAJ1003508.1 DUF4311 domain-containing protein [Brevibacillus aydinogluensis]
MVTWMIALKSMVIGALVGFGVGAGAARMFHAPNVQGMGAFRTFGELNACAGDPISHFSFGLGFFFNSWASVVGAGALTQDVDHRILPNWTAALLLWKNKNVEETLHDPKKMAIVGAVVGAVVVTLLNSTATAIPQSMQLVATKVLVPAANWLINPIMPIVFWMAAMDAGKRTGVWGTVLGGFSHLVMGNAVPGIVLGILIGKGLDDSGWNRITKTLVTAVVLLFILSGFFRAFDVALLKSIQVDVPQWLIDLHEMFGSVVNK